MGRSPCCSKEGLNRGAWTAQEDKILKEYIRVHGEGRWRNLPKKAGLKRCGKSCRLRWKNYLRPDVKRGNISSDEEELIIRLHKLLGNRWSLIAGRLPGRTDNEIKNYWNTNFGKKVKYSNRRGRTSTSRGNNTLNPSLKLAPMASTPLTPKLDSNVTFPKATKCSKVLLLNPLPNPTVQFIPNESNAEAAVEAEEAAVADAAVACSSLRNQIESLTLDSEFLLCAGEEEELPIDLLMDFNVDDVLLSDILNSDISNTYNNFFSCSDDNARNPSDKLPTCSDQVDPTFSDELLTDWS